MLLSVKDFEGVDVDVSIPGTEKSVVRDALLRMIYQYEPVFLASILGVDLFNAFMAGTIDNWLPYPSDAQLALFSAKATVDARWANLITGTLWYYPEGGRTYSQQWAGLLPILRRYIYYYFVQSQASRLTGIGDVVPSTENGTVINPSRRMRTAWNQMGRLLIPLWGYLENVKDISNTLIYPEYDPKQIPFYRFQPKNILDI